MTTFLIGCAAFGAGWVTGKALWPWVLEKAKSLYARVRGEFP